MAANCRLRSFMSQQRPNTQITNPVMRAELITKACLSGSRTPYTWPSEKEPLRQQNDLWKFCSMCFLSTFVFNMFSIEFFFNVFPVISTCSVPKTKMIGSWTFWRRSGPTAGSVHWCFPVIVQNGKTAISAEQSNNGGRHRLIISPANNLLERPYQWNSRHIVMP